MEKPTITEKQGEQIVAALTTIAASLQAVALLAFARRCRLRQAYPAFRARRRPWVP